MIFIDSMADVMSASEPELADPVHGERRMSITGCACDIMIEAVWAAEERNNGK